MKGSRLVPQAGPNERAIADVLTVTPRLVAVKPAGEVVPGMHPKLLLHAAPPTDWASLAPSVHAALAADLVLDDGDRRRGGDRPGTAGHRLMILGGAELGLGR